MIQQIKLSKVYINNIGKDGNRLITKSGNPYTLVTLMFDDKKASMFCDDKYGAKDLEVIRGWKEGDTVTLNLEQNGEWLNASLPKKTELLEERLARIEKWLEGKGYKK